ncbi:MAG: hypothetical protein M0Q46_00685 [Endomicrobiales bacterium]|nr:hypothetical protein [Endomicrobiales bacterium]
MIKCKLQRPIITKKPWGSEELFAHTSRYAAKILVINKGHRLSLQYHRVKDETLLLLSGQLRLVISDGKTLKESIISKNVAFHLPPKTIHRMEALEKCILVEVSTPQLKDVVRLHDDYNREKKNG